MPGTQPFTYLNIGKETVRGTPVAPTRQIYAGGTGILAVDRGQNFHETENAGVRTPIRRVTQQTEDVTISVPAYAVSYDDLVWPLSSLKGAMTGVGAGADKTWTATPSMTAANNPDSFSVDVGDETQNFRCQYAMWRTFTIAASRGGMTTLEGELFAQRAVKTAKANPALNVGVKIPGDIWTIKHATTLAGLAGASIVDNYLMDWALEVSTGIVWQHAMNGNLYGSEHVETWINATLTANVKSTALAISEVYDKAAADTMSFIRLKATGPTLGASNYSAQIDLPVLYEVPEIIGSEEDGVNLYGITARLAYDGTSAGSIVPIVVNSLAALP